MNGEQHKDNPGILQLERPADGRSAGPQAEQNRAKGGGDQHNASGISQSVAADDGFTAASLGQTDRFQAEYRKDAGHQVEQQAAQ